MRKLNVLDNFYYRYANQPIENQDTIFQNKTIQSQDKEKYMFIIFTGSRNLVEKVVNKNNYSNDEIISWKKYLLRMSSRSTPYGYLAGVGIGHFDDSNELNLTENTYHCSIDNLFSSDIIIFVTLVYFKSVSAQMKIIIDRLCFLSHLMCLKNKIGVIVVSSSM